MSDTKAIAKVFAAQEEFDFEEAAKIAKAAGWKYGRTEGDSVSIEELRSCLACNVNTAISSLLKNHDKGIEKQVYVSSGRFSVRVDYFTPGNAEVQINFGMSSRGYVY